MPERKAVSHAINKISSENRDEVLDHLSLANLPNKRTSGELEPLEEFCPLVVDDDVSSIYNLLTELEVYPKEADSVPDDFYKSDDLPNLDLELSKLFEGSEVPDKTRARVESLIGFVVQCAKAGEPLPTVELLSKAVAEAGPTPEAKASVVPTRTASLPLKPLELWAKREIKRGGENPVKFIQRVYAAELKAGTLTRMSLGADPSLYQAYASWIGRHPEDDLKLPTRRDLVNARVAAIGQSASLYRDARTEATDVVREKLRLNSTLNARKSRAKNAILRS